MALLDGIGSREKPAFIILDLMLPECLAGDRKILNRIPQRANPIMMLPAKAEEIARNRGLGFGADDYVTKTV